MKRLSLIIGVLALAASPALAAWVGDVADVAPADTIVNQTTSATFSDLALAYAAALPNETLLVGPGLYDVSAAVVLANANSVSVIGSGSGTDPNTSSIFDGGGVLGSFMDISAGGVDAANPLVFKDIRAKSVTAGHYTFRADASYVVFDNLAIVDYGQGWGDGIERNGGFVNYVKITNSLFEAGRMGIRLAGYTITSNDWLVDGNTFKTGSHGVTLNVQNAARWTITNNEFIEMNYTGNDPWNLYGASGIALVPRLNAGETALIQDVLIQGNLFQDNGYVADPNDPMLLKPPMQLSAGIESYVFQNCTIDDLMIRDNTFEETAAGGTMEAAVKMMVTDYGRRNLGVDYAPWDPNTPPVFNPPAAGNTPGVYSNVSIAANTYIGLATPIQGTTYGSATNPNPEIVPVNVAGVAVSGVTKVGDTDADDDIDLADINATAAGPGRNALIQSGLDTSLGDTDLSYVVDILDLGALANKYNKPGVWGFEHGDTNGDTTVDINDLGNLANDYNKSFELAPGTPGYVPSASSVPEPTTLALLGLMGVGLLRRRR